MGIVNIDKSSLGKVKVWGGTRKSGTKLKIYLGFPEVLLLSVTDSFKAGLVAAFTRLGSLKHMEVHCVFFDWNPVWTLRAKLWKPA